MSNSEDPRAPNGAMREAIDAESMSVRELFARVKISQLRTFVAMCIGLLVATFAFGVKFNDTFVEFKRPKETAAIEQIRSLEKKLREIERIIERSHLANNEDLEILRRKLLAVWNSYLVRMEVRDSLTARPIAGARVEIHEVSVPDADRKIILRSIEEIVVRGSTDTEGRAYFGFRDQEFENFGTRFVVMVFAAGYSPRSKALQYTINSLRSLSEAERTQGRAVEFSHHEVADRDPSETLVFDLERI